MTAAAAEREIIYRGVVLISISGSGECLRWHAARWNIARVPGGFTFVDEESYGPFATEFAAQQQFGPDRFPPKSWWQRRQGFFLP